MVSKLDKLTKPWRRRFLQERVGHPVKVVERRGGGGRGRGREKGEDEEEEEKGWRGIGMRGRGTKGLNE